MQSVTKLTYLPMSVPTRVAVTKLALFPVPNWPYELAPQAYNTPSSERAMECA